MVYQKQSEKLGQGHFKQIIICMKSILYTIISVFTISTITVFGQGVSKTIIEKALYYNKTASELYKTNPEKSILYSDSSLAILPDDKFTDERMQAISNKAFGYFYLKKYDSTLILMKQGLKFAKSFNNTKSEANMLGQIGIYFLFRGELDSSLVYNKKSITQLKSIYENKADTSNDHLMNISKTLSNTAQVYIKKGDYENAFTLNIEALKFREMAKAPPQSIGKLTINIAGLYVYIKDYKNAKGYYLQALDIFEPEKDLEMMEMIYGNLGVVFKNLGDTSEAINYYKKSLRLNDELNNDKQKAKNLGNLATLYMDKSDYEIAERYFLEALELGKNLEDKYSLAQMYKNLGLIYQKTNRYEKAISNMNKCLGLAKPEKMNTLIQSAELSLSELYYKLGNYKKAYQHHLQFHRVYDTINNISNKNRVAELQTQFETEKKKKEILVLNADKAEKELLLEKQKAEIMTQRLISFGVLAFLMIIAVLAGLLFNRFKLKQKAQRTELEKENLEVESRLLRSQMNPHFIFNSLNSIQNFILKNDNKQAANYLLMFSKLMRNVLNLSREPVVVLSDDLQTLELNLQIEKLRMKEKFDYFIDVDPEIDTEAIYIPPMILQPYVENAIKHGIGNKSSAGKIKIEINISGKHLLCLIDDNGVGRGFSAKQK
ncbi:MAG: hypothetical protein DRJ05_12500, partial [Bacteroidetes bacterium]